MLSRGIVFGAGEMVEAVRDVECQLIVEFAALRALAHRTVDIDDEVAAPRIVLAGDGVVAEADDVGWAILSKIFPVGLRDSFVINQNDSNLTPCDREGFLFRFLGKPVSQLLELLNLNRVFCLLILNACYHRLWDRVCGREACLTVKR